MANDQNLRPFKKGYDSRRGSKPKGSIHLSTHIREYLNDVNVIDKLSKGKKTDEIPIRAILEVLMGQALEGQHKAIDILFKYGFGQEKKELDKDERLVVVTRVHRNDKETILE